MKKINQGLLVFLVVVLISVHGCVEESYIVNPASYLLIAPRLNVQDTSITESYTISWSKSFPTNWAKYNYGVIYVVQESRDTLFANPIVIYEGTETSYQVPAKPFNTFWYYRVHARTDDMSGNWSAVKRVAVIPKVGWILRNSGTTQNLKGVAYLDTSTAIVIGGNGTILRTTDLGKTWTPQVSGVSVSLNAISFADSRNGIVVGDGGVILRTSDQGLTWTKQTSGTSYNLYTASFVNSAIAYTFVMGESERCFPNGPIAPIIKMIKTTDGGNVWTKRSALCTVWVPYCQAFITPTNGFFFAGSTPNSPPFVVRTSDGGATWLYQLFSFRGIIRANALLNANNCIAVGLETTDIVNTNIVPVIIYSSDGGASWVRKETGLQLPIGSWVSYSSFLGVSFPEPLVGTIVGSNGIIVRTIDGGETWSPQLVNPDFTLNGVSFSDRNHGIAVGNRGVIITTANGGNR